MWYVCSEEAPCKTGYLQEGEVEDLLISPCLSPPLASGTSTVTVSPRVCERKRMGGREEVINPFTLECYKLKREPLVGSQSEVQPVPHCSAETFEGVSQTQ